MLIGLIITWALVATVVAVVNYLVVIQMGREIRKWKDMALKYDGSGGHIAHEGVRGFYCNGPGSKFSCKDCVR